MNLLHEWLDALRSGTYEQTRERLRDGDGFCCLGVACDIAAQHGMGYWDGDDFILTEDGEEVCAVDVNLPSMLYDVFHIDALTTDSDVLILNTRRSFQSSLQSLNDNDRKTFEEIADIIEKRAAEKGLLA